MAGNRISTTARCFVDLTHSPRGWGQGRARLDTGAHEGGRFGVRRRGVLEEHTVLGVAKHEFEGLLRPDHAVHGLAGRTSNGTYRVYLLGRLRLAFVTLELLGDDDR